MFVCMGAFSMDQIFAMDHEARIDQEPINIELNYLGFLYSKLNTTESRLTESWFFKRFSSESYKMKPMEAYKRRIEDLCPKSSTQGETGHPEAESEEDRQAGTSSTENMARVLLQLGLAAAPLGRGAERLEEYCAWDPSRIDPDRIYMV